LALRRAIPFTSSGGLMIFIIRFPRALPQTHLRAATDASRALGEKHFHAPASSE